MGIKISNFQFSEYLVDEESIAAYLSAIMEEENPKLLLSAISDIAKARGMSREVVKKSTCKQLLK